MSSPDQQAFREIFTQYYESLCNYAFRMLKDRAWAEDTVQELFVELWKKQTLTSAKNPASFLLRALKFRCIDQLRKPQHITDSIDAVHDLPASQAPDSLSELEIQAWVDYFVAQLPPKTRKVFLLSRSQGLTYQEIAQQEQLSIKTVENQMSRALKILRKLIKQTGILLLISSLIIYG
ncbi:MAG: RNA polymerase sigma-70 factor [Bacteroidota bacterium]